MKAHIGGNHVMGLSSSRSARGCGSARRPAPETGPEPIGGTGASGETADALEGTTATALAEVEEEEIEPARVMPK